MKNNNLKTITIFGATGTIGQNTLKILRTYPKKFKLIGVSAHDNVKLIIEIIKNFKPQYVVISNEEKYKELMNYIKNSNINPNIKILVGKQGLLELASIKADIFIAAIVGIAGLPSVFKAIEHGTTIALANKESLVCAGSIILQKLKQFKAQLLPIDSEHSAIHRIIGNHPKKHIEQIILTASGGPFLNTPLDQFDKITPIQAVKHPNWCMGAKISIDSATMVNKGLEIIEAYYLFPVEKKQISAIIHPESIVHSYISFIDGSIIAELSNPDMQIAIAYTLSYPDKLNLKVNRLKLDEIHNLTFQKINYQKFPALNTAINVLKEEGVLTTIFNSANEELVKAFLEKKINFTDISRILEKTVTKFTKDNYTPNNLEDIYNADLDARLFIKSIIKSN